MGSSDRWSRRRRVHDPALAPASLAPPVTVYLSVLAGRGDRGWHVTVTAGRVDHDPAAVATVPVVPVRQAGERWHRHSHPSLRQVPARPVGREISYDVARYLALDTLSAVGGLAGFSIAGPAGMVAGFLATAVARGVVSGTIGVLRARATRADPVPAARRLDGSRAPGKGPHLRAGQRADAGRRARDERGRSVEAPSRGR